MASAKRYGPQDRSRLHPLAAKNLPIADREFALTGSPPGAHRETALAEFADNAKSESFLVEASAVGKVTHGHRGFVVTVKVVLAIPAAVFTEGGAKPQPNPAGAWHEKLTLSANPPDGITVTVKLVDCPAVTVAPGGVVPN
jgi:hypothetical protein